jgi:hypothetical protein
MCEGCKVAIRTNRLSKIGLQQYVYRYLRVYKSDALVTTTKQWQWWHQPFSNGPGIISDDPGWRRNVIIEVGGPPQNCASSWLCFAHFFCKIDINQKKVWDTHPLPPALVCLPVPIVTTIALSILEFTQHCVSSQELVWRFDKRTLPRAYTPNASSMRFWRYGLPRRGLGVI